MTYSVCIKIRVLCNNKEASGLGTYYWIHYNNDTIIIIVGGDNIDNDSIIIIHFFVASVRSEFDC